MTNETTEEHAPFDFLAAAAVLTNEQKILATLEAICAQMTKHWGDAQGEPKQAETPEQHKSKIAALQARVTGNGRRK